MRPLVLILAAGVVTFLASFFGPAALAGKPGPDGASDARRGELRGVNFVETCRFSHSAPDDPIVFPAKAGASHDHTFVGNRSTSASSTYESLRAAPTSCTRRADTAGYWVPTLLQNGTAVHPTGRDDLLPPRHARAGDDVPEQPPHDRRRRERDLAAGHARDVLELRRALGRPAVDDSPTCPDARGSFLRLHVRFPSCWDGSQPRQRRPQEPHGVRDGAPLPVDASSPGARVTQIYRYPTRGGDGFTLASGGQFSAHADFLNAWRPAALERLVDECLNALVHCGRR